MSSMADLYIEILFSHHLQRIPRRVCIASGGLHNVVISDRLVWRSCLDAQHLQFTGNSPPAIASARLSVGVSSVSMFPLASCMPVNFRRWL